MSEQKALPCQLVQDQSSPDLARHALTKQCFVNQSGCYDFDGDSLWYILQVPVLFTPLGTVLKKGLSPMSKNWCEIPVTVCKRGSLYHISEYLLRALKVSDLKHDTCRLYFWPWDFKASWRETCSRFYTFSFFSPAINISKAWQSAMGELFTLWQTKYSSHQGSQHTSHHVNKAFLVCSCETRGIKGFIFSPFNTWAFST